ncbi:hypothetical protein CTRI78_v010607 [Colletotrichum trifolii]|uniref:F-box domain-containing protein n=1 Tax=Colletotrichum trifolii TaxID=5466 RepID=A0A4R8QM73_COLTR|nr:hypothetical protein CTRI78_v010607 [Colletotrichum trifolii]
MASERTQRAVDVALAIPELLESILAQLDITTLLVSASRVSKRWKALMDESPAVQQALFFSPILCFGDARDEDQGHRTASEQPIRRINPLLARKFDKCFFDFGPTYAFHRRANSFYELSWSPRPTKIVQEIWGGWSQSRPEEMDDEKAALQKAYNESFTRKGASWRRMLVSQPPPPGLGYLRFDISDIPAEGHLIKSAMIRPKSDSPFAGLRMGQLYDLVQNEVGHHGRHSLWFRVLHGRAPGNVALSKAKETIARFMGETNVVVEFMHADDTSLPNHPKDPADAIEFDAAFRSEEYREVEVKVEEETGYPAEFPMFEGQFVVWHWKLLEYERIAMVSG